MPASRVVSPLTSAQVRSLVEAFENASLRRSEWTHEAHLTVGLWYVLEYGVDLACRRLRKRIRRLNRAIGIVNDDSNGYHETLTVFYLRSIEAFTKTRTPNDSRSDMLAQLLTSELAEREFPLCFYTKELLFSVEARTRWVPPNVRSMPSPDDFADA